MRKHTASFMVAVLLLGVASLAHAQVRTTGIIQGSVVDADGLPLPGVQITATSPALIGDQTVFSGNDGSYRIPLLPAGQYTVEFRLQGFSTLVRENVDVGVRRVTSIEVTMQLSSVEETVTVTARTPLVDVKTTKRSSEYQDAILNNLPETRGVGTDLMNLAPEATSASGSNSFQGNPTFFGSTTRSNAFQVDGVTVTDPGGGAQFPFYSPDWFDVVEITSTGAGADIGKAQGAVFNVVTKSGGNSFHGETNFFYQNDSFLGDNTEGVESTVAEFEAPELDYQYDFTANVGGPLRQDEVWFFGGYQAFYESQTESLFPTETENSDRFFGKLTWQVNRDNRLIGSAMVDTFTIDGRAPFFGTQATQDVTAFEPSANLTPNITWNSVLSPDAFLEVKYSGFYGFFDTVPVTEAAAVYDVGETFYLPGSAYWGHYTFDRARTNLQGNVSYFAEDYAGDHSFKFGAEWEQISTDDRVAFQEGGIAPGTLGLPAAYLAYFGDVYFAYTFDDGFNRSTTSTTATTLYVQDDWTIADRVTLNLGVRFDRWNPGYKENDRADLPTFNDVSPRIGANIDLLGDGRTSVHGFYGRFYEEAHGSIWEDFDPGQSVATNFFSPNGFFGGFPDDWEVDSSVDPIADLAIDPDLSNQWSEQFAVGIDHQVTEDWAISGRYVLKRDRNIIGAEDIGTAFIPVQVVAANGNTLTVFTTDDVDPFRVLVNDPTCGRTPAFCGGEDQLFRDYDGVQIKGVKRLSNDWSLIASWLVQKTEGNAGNGAGGNLGGTTTYDTPNEFINTPGELDNSRRHVIKVQSSYLMPDPIRVLVGGVVQFQSSARYNMTERFSDIIPTAIDNTVPIEEIGSRTIDDQVKIDLRLEKKFQLQSGWGDVGFVVDVFNLLNDDTVIGIFERVPDFGETTILPRPRELRVGARWIF